MLHRNRWPFFSLPLTVPPLPPAGRFIIFDAQEALKKARSAGISAIADQGGDRLMTDRE
jgi:hypothetical protein